jgi:hypothetical protein
VISGNSFLLSGWWLNAGFSLARIAVHASISKCEAMVHGSWAYKCLLDHSACERGQFAACRCWRINECVSATNRVTPLRVFEPLVAEYRCRGPRTLPFIDARILTFSGHREIRCSFEQTREKKGFELRPQGRDVIRKATPCVATSVCDTIHAEADFSEKRCISANVYSRTCPIVSRATTSSLASPGTLRSDTTNIQRR